MSNIETIFALMPTLTEYHKEFQELEILQISTKYIMKTKILEKQK
jgi:hypothetical protein